MEYYTNTMVEQEYEQIVDDDDQVIGFEEGRIWLPNYSHVLLGPHQQKPSQLNKQSAHRRPHHDYHKQYYHHQNRRSKISLADYQYSILQHKYHQHRPRFPISNRVSSAGPGMQAVFLDSGRRTSSCGTGFFLPQRAGNTTFQPNKKSAYSPVFLPSRVVQALNLNVHELGSQLAPRRDSNISKNGARDDIDDDVVALDQSSTVNSTLCSVASQTRSPSPEIFLPKEWTY